MVDFGKKMVRLPPKTAWGGSVRSITRRTVTTRTPVATTRSYGGTAATIVRAASATPAAPAQQAVAGLPAQRLTAAMPTGGISVGGITGSITTAGSDIFNAIGKLVPLAIQVVLAVIVIKIVLYLMRGRRR